VLWLVAPLGFLAACAASQDKAIGAGGAPNAGGAATTAGATTVGGSTASGGSSAIPFELVGCATSPTQSVAPGGYYVNGNTICTADGRAHYFHGVARPSLEWSSVGTNLSLADFQLMATWKANVVRIALNQDFWLAESPLCDPYYRALVDDAVAWAEIASMDVILDLHWSDAGVLGSCVSTPTSGCQQMMPDANSLTFWSEVAARYRSDGRVLFELYNEPHDVSWATWKSGGMTNSGFQAIGMQQLYDTVRATGAQNLVLVGGLNWGFDLSGVPENRIDGYNILYVTHPYNSPGRRPSNWDKAWGFLTQTDPVIVTEFGTADASCVTDYSATLIEYADAHGASWTAWAWYPGGCTFPAIIDDWSATPSAVGAMVKAALLGYADPPASPPAAGGSGPDLNYTFDHGTQGWALNRWDDPDLTNLAAAAPNAGSTPTLQLAETSGDPEPGALRLTVAFNDHDQYAAVDADLYPGLNLTDKTLYARVRLLSSTFFDGGVQLYAVSGPPYIVEATPTLDATNLMSGAWLPLTLTLSSTTPAGFDPSKTVEVGVRFSSSAAAPTDGGSLDSGRFANTGDVVFEIDSVTD
jgi:endoglucanase